MSAPLTPSTPSPAAAVAARRRHTGRIVALIALVLIAHLWLLSCQNGWFLTKKAGDVAPTAFQTRPGGGAGSTGQVPSPRPGDGASAPAVVVAEATRSTDSGASSPATAGAAQPASAPGNTGAAAGNTRVPAPGVATFGVPGKPLATRPPAAPPHGGSTAGATATAPGSAAPGLSAADAAATTEPGTVPPGAPALLAPPLRLVYRVSGQARRIPYAGLSGELRWQHDGAHYAARLEIGAPFLGKRVQTSTGDVDAGGLQPRRYSDRARSELAAHFEREKGQISFSANTPATPLLAGAQDRLSILLQLAGQLEAQPTLARPGTRWVVQTVGPREAEIWQLELEAAETLDLPGGPTATWRLVRAPQREYDTRVEVWLAPARHHLPVQLRLTQASGDRVQLTLESADNP